MEIKYAKTIEHAKLLLPKDYVTKIGVKETQAAIWKIRSIFEKQLCEELKLQKVQAPLFCKKSSGINDDLNDVERKVCFDCPFESQETFEVMQSLAKWKRQALKDYGLSGLVVNGTYIRRDEVVDNIHSVYVDQFDWEKVITKQERTEEFLKEIVRKIYFVFLETTKFVSSEYGLKFQHLPEEISFVSTFELEKKYPDCSPQEREAKIAKEKGAVFIGKIGGALKDGKKHDGRAPDYDDWTLNGDIVVWNDILKIPFEISSMGIRVDKESLLKQLKIENVEFKKKFKYHQDIIKEELPLTIGGGIGISRLLMFFLHKAHLGEVQCSIWPSQMKKDCEKHGISLL